MGYQDWLLGKPDPRVRSAWRLDYVSNASVQVYLTYREYYHRLRYLFGNLMQGDEIFLVGWGFTRNQRLDDPAKQAPFLPERPKRGWLPTAEQQQSLEYVLKTAILSNVKVRLLATGNNPFRLAENAEMVASLNRIKPGVAATDDQVFTNRVTRVTHHQKAVYIRSQKDGNILFIGGMDVTHERESWLDLQAEIAGVGADLGLQTMNERWASAVDGQVFTPPPISLGPNGGETYLQFVRTYGDSRKYIIPGKPNFERKYARDDSYFRLLEAAIGKAESFIYLEDQFFRCDVRSRC